MTVIEWLISFFITILIVIVVFQLSAKIYSNLLRGSQFNNLFAENYSALEHISRTISGAPHQKNKWSKFGDREVVWWDQLQKKNIGYKYEKKKIFFLVGKRKNLIATNISNFKLTPNIDNIDNNEIKSIKCFVEFEIKNKSCSFKRLICLKNRIV